MSASCPLDTPPASTLPPRDERASAPPKTTDTPRTFPQFASHEAWKAHQIFIRHRILVSCSLYPLPEKRSVPDARVFDRIERDGYTIEKVWIETYSGFYLAGNLYRPQSSGSFPAVLVAHGHFAEGRFTDNPTGSIAARAITFARQGYVAFTYDMVGFGDTQQINHQFANDRQSALWGVSLMGLQLWNSLRALDWLAALPDVDTKRLAMTGESGGATQTMLMGAIDDRLAAVAPVVMVSHSMQGGCLCESAPGLRLDISNMEIAAAACPKAQILVGASGDWTKTTTTIEGPAIQFIYEMEGAADKLEYVQYDFGHNINRTSREAVYAFFGKHLLNQTDANALKEPPYQKEPDDALRVFSVDDSLPDNACTDAELIRHLQIQSESELEQAKPINARTLAKFCRTYLPLWQHTLAVEMPALDNLRVEVLKSRADVGPISCSLPVSNLFFEQLAIGRGGKGGRIPVMSLTTEREGSRPAVIFAHPGGIFACLGRWIGTTAHFQPRLELFTPLQELLANGFQVVLLNAFETGENAPAVSQPPRDYDANYFTTYNRTALQEQVQDLLTVTAYLRAQPNISRVLLIGQERAGLWAMLAAPAADGVAADCDGLDLTTDDALLSDELYIPGLRRMGDFRTALTLAAPHPLLLHNTGDKFAAQEWISDVYRVSDAPERLQMRREHCDYKELYDWLISDSRPAPRHPILRLPPTVATTKE